MHALSGASLTMAAAIGWTYLVTNAARIFTFLPQIVAVWRSTDGARAISLCTWSAWLVSHVTAVLYGALVTHDVFFVLISLINFFGCGTVTLIAWRRRLQWRRRERASSNDRGQPPSPVVAPQALLERFDFAAGLRSSTAAQASASGAPAAESHWSSRIFSAARKGG